MHAPTNLGLLQSLYSQDTAIPLATSFFVLALVTNHTSGRQQNHTNSASAVCLVINLTNPILCFIMCSNGDPKLQRSNETSLFCLLSKRSAGHRYAAFRVQGECAENRVLFSQHHIISGSLHHGDQISICNKSLWCSIGSTECTRSCSMLVAQGESGFTALLLLPLHLVSCQSGKASRRSRQPESPK